MSTAVTRVRRLRLDPRSAGMLLTAAEFDRARFAVGWRYEYGRDKDEVQVIPENQTYKTPLLPGFELPLARLLKLANQWAKKRRRKPK